MESGRGNTTGEKTRKNRSRCEIIVRNQNSTNGQRKIKKESKRMIRKDKKKRKKNLFRDVNTGERK